MKVGRPKKKRIREARERAKGSGPKGMLKCCSCFLVRHNIRTCKVKELVRVLKRQLKVDHGILSLFNVFVF